MRAHGNPAVEHHWPLINLRLPQGKTKKALRLESCLSSGGQGDLNHRYTDTARACHYDDVKLTVIAVPLVVVTVLLAGLKTCPNRDGVTV